MTIDPIIGKIVGHTMNANGQKVDYAPSAGNSYTKAQQLGEEFIGFLKNDKDQYSKNGDDLLSKEEAKAGFKKFLELKYGATSECVAYFDASINKSVEDMFGLLKANKNSISAATLKDTDTELSFQHLINPPASGAGELILFPSFQCLADDNQDAFSIIANRANPDNGLCEAAPVPPTSPILPAPIQPITPPVPAKITTLALTGLNGSLDQATGVFTVGSRDTYAKIAAAVLKDDKAKKVIEAQLVAYNAAHPNANEQLTLNQYTEKLLQAQAVKEGAGKADEARWPLQGKAFNLYEALNTPLPLPANSIPTAPTEPATEPGTTIITTTHTSSGGDGLFGGLSGLGSKWLLVLGAAVGLGFLLQGQRNA